MKKQEIMTMQQPMQSLPSKQIPQDVLDRLESEWKQIRESAPPLPAQR
jgi:archaellum component FlaD/FlaE